MKSLCFACGHQKPDALVVCAQCEVKPISDKDRVNSVCLSDVCFDADTLEKASRYIRQKRKLPKLGEKAIAKATDFVKALDSTADNPYTLMDVDDSFFDFDGFDSDKGETVKVHSIGKGASDEPPMGIGRAKKTYLLLEWELGKEISFEDADKYSDDDGDIYIQYTWRGEQGWIWKYIAKRDFDQVKALEDL